MEDYKKKYEDALERAKKAINDNWYYTKNVMECVFPELKESEEEKARKELVEWLKRKLASPSIGFNPSKMEDWIAYLEKLKDVDKELEEAYKNGDGVFFKKGYDAAMDEMKKQGKSSAQIHYWTEEEIEPIISDYLRGAEHYGGMIARLRCLKPKSLEKQGEFPATISVDKMVEEFEDFKVMAGRIPSLAEIDAYRKGVTDVLSKVLIKEEKPITIGSKKAEGKLGEMVAASKEPAESGEDKELTHSKVTKKSDKDKEIDTCSLLFHKDDRDYEVIKLIRSAMLYCPHMEEEDRKKVNSWLKFVQKKLY